MGLRESTQARISRGGFTSRLAGKLRRPAQERPEDESKCIWDLGGSRNVFWLLVQLGKSHVHGLCPKAQGVEPRMIHKVSHTPHKSKAGGEDSRASISNLLCSQTPLGGAIVEMDQYVGQGLPWLKKA